MSSASFVHGGYPQPSFVPDPDVEGEHEIEFSDYEGEAQLPDIVRLIEKELSEPYIIYTYRYFLQAWPQLCIIAHAFRQRKQGEADSDDARRRVPVGVIISKLERHHKGDRLMRGYIAMLSVHMSWRGRGIAKGLAQRSVQRLVDMGAQEIVLETEVDNAAALALYGSLDFIREKRLFRFYLNGKDAFRLVYPCDVRERRGHAPDPDLHVEHQQPTDSGLL